MKNPLPMIIAAAALVSGAAVEASDPIGVYALIDRLVFEPGDGKSNQVQVWGVFELADPGTRGDVYRAPQRGYLYYRLPEGQEDAARIEWNDLRTLAGSGKVAGFGGRFQPNGRVRSGCDEPADPDDYPVAMGVVPFAGDTEYPPVRTLLSMPIPISPADGSALDSELVNLRVRNLLDPARPPSSYAIQFRIWRLQKASEEVVAESPEVIPGDSETGWTATSVPAGWRYFWTARAIDAAGKGPEMQACFQIPFLRGEVNGDGAVDISDAVAVLEILFLGRPLRQPLIALDINGDDNRDISDSVYLLTHLFLGGPPPPAPFPNPGIIPILAR